MKNSIFSIILVSIFSLLEMSCSSQKELKITGDETPIVSFAKERCRGFCPAYTLEIFESNKLRYTGQANVKIMGEQIFNLKKEEVINLKKAFEASEFEKFEREYLSGYMDIPKFTLIYKGQRIDYHEKSATEEIKELSALVDRYFPKEKKD